MRVRRGLAPKSLLVLAGLGAGCGDSPVGGRSVDDPAQLVVQLRDNHFDPAVADVEVGATVVWDFATANRPHNVVFENGRSSDTLDDGVWNTPDHQCYQRRGEQRSLHPRTASPCTRKPASGGDEQTDYDPG